MEETQPEMIEAVVWDMGGIMYRYFTELLVDRGQAEGWPLERLPLGPTGPGPDPFYPQILDGSLSEPQYVEKLKAALAEQGVRIDPHAELDWVDQERPETWKTIQAIHDGGIKQALLTNDASKWLGDRWWEDWQGTRFFEVVIDVVTVGVRKPAPEPYLAAIEALALPAERCLFVDDLPINCAGAEAVGMASHLFDITAPESSLARLETRLGVHR